MLALCRKLIPTQAPPRVRRSWAFLCGHFSGRLTPEAKTGPGTAGNPRGRDTERTIPPGQERQARARKRGEARFSPEEIRQAERLKTAFFCALFAFPSILFKYGIYCLPIISVSRIAGRLPPDAFVRSRALKIRSILHRGHKICIDIDLQDIMFIAKFRHLIVLRNKN